jgi:hypothetical protein
MNNALITDEQRVVLLANGRESLENPDFDPAPVVKLFTPDAGATWLLTEIDPDDHDHAFGLCDLGLGMPEIGWVSLGELATVRGGWACRSSATVVSRREAIERLCARCAAGRTCRCLTRPWGVAGRLRVAPTRRDACAPSACSPGKALQAIPAAQACAP